MSERDPARRGGATTSEDPPDVGNVVAHLAATTLFANIDPARLLPLAPIFQVARYQPGETIAHEGRVDTSLRVLIQGSASLQHTRPDGGVEHQGIMGYGGVIGTTGVFTGRPRPNAAVAFEPVTLLYLDGGVLWEILRTDATMLDRLVLTDELRAGLKMPAGQEVSGGEITVGVYRRHWFYALPRIVFLPLTLFGFISVIVYGVFQALRFGSSPGAVLVMALLAVSLPLAAALWLFFDYWHDYLLVTNRRVLHVERTPLIDERRSAARLERIQDVRVVQPGLVSKILNSGDLSIQTASTRKTVKFEDLAKPAEARDIIFEQMKLARERAQSERQALIARKILAAMGRAPMDPPDALMQAATVEVEEEPFSLLRPILDHLLPRTRMESPDGTVTWRKHWFNLLMRGWMPLGLFFSLSALALFIQAGLVPGMEPSVMDAGWLWLLGVWLVLSVWAWWAFEDWRNDLYQLTDDMLIDIQRKPLGLFSSQQQAPLAQIQDVRYVIPNPVAAILKFGDIVVETAAESGGLTFEYIYHPESVQEEIFFRLDQKLAANQKSEQDRRDEELIRWISAYHQATNFEPGDPLAEERLAEWMERNPPPGT